MRYATDFKNFDLDNRVHLLQDANIPVKIDNGWFVLPDDMDPDYDLTRGQKTLWEFCRNPTSPLDFKLLDSKTGKVALGIHTNFWMQRFNGSL